MNRKNTILIAVLINAGLLTVLFITALSTQDSVQMPTNPTQLTQKELPSFDDTPLYQELETVVTQQAKEIKEPEPVVHALPQLAEPEKPVVNEPVVVAKTKPVEKRKPKARVGSEIVVKKGDNLERLARRHHTTVDEIIKLNRLPSSFLKIGQVLQMPPSHTIAKSEPQTGPEYYTIKVGENPWAIALRHHMKLDDLLRLNGLNEEKARRLRPGDRLRIR